MCVKTLTLLFATLAYVSAYTDFCQNAANLNWTISSNPSLVVWTYDAFMEGTSESDIIGPFASTNNLALSDIVVCRKQSVALVDALKSIPTTFSVPNVVIGLDNVLAFLAPQSNFTDFTSQHEAEMVPVVTTLGHFQHMKPFDYGLVGVYFNSSIIPELAVADTNHIFNLPWFVNSGLMSQFVTIDPTKDTAGLAFLMWTIAELGDPDLQFVGKYNYTGGWRSWWKLAFQNHITISNTWTEAFQLFQASDTIINMFSSYGSSPAYDWCFSGDDKTRAITSWYNGVRYGWAQVEAIALLRNTTAAWNFVDYLLSRPFQNTIAQRNFMNPVNANATISQCYQDVVIQPTQVTLLNTYISATQLSQLLDQHWLSTWKSLYATYYSPANITIPTPIPTPPPTGGMSYPAQPSLLAIIILFLAAIMM